MNDQQRKWQQLVAAEPELERLLDLARSVKDDPASASFCANEIWYGYGAYRGRGIKGEMQSLVGYDRHHHPLLSTSQAYDVAYQKIYRALPDCRNCWCFPHP